MDHEGAAPSAPNGNGHNAMGELAGALAKAQASFGRVVKDKTAKVESKTGASYEYRYADLATLIDVIRKPLSENGLVYVQTMDLGERGITLVTTLLHVGGAKLHSYYPLASHDRPQDMGSEITYARRYTLSALLGIASEDDDDGAAAQQAAPKIAGYYRGPAPKSNVPAEVIGQPDRPTGPPTTAAEAADAFPLLESGKKSPVVAAIQQGAITKENREERERLLKDAHAVRDELGMSDDQADTVWATYCGAATPKNVDVQALKEMIGYLNLTLDKKKSA